MKDKMKSLGISVVLLGMALSKYMGNKFGVNGRIYVGIGALIFVLIGVIILIFFKKYSAVLVICFLFLPLIMSLIGIYLNNIYIVLAGVALFIVFWKIIIKVLSWFNKNKK